jgi:diaminohydroxyphosphoribosylaminopyrimidine deaminase/5-amino-6-(5-phosphoribosylamino)uracil reductase
VRVARTVAGHIDLGSALKALALRGVTRILGEGGPTLGSRLIAESFADEVVLFTNRKPLGHQGRASLDAAARARLADPAFYRLADDSMLGEDRRRRYERIL